MTVLVGNIRQGKAQEMPIQFRCKNCQSWIEVDQEHAGGKAICPFCQAINDVPKAAAGTGAPAGTQETAGASTGQAPPPGTGPLTGVPTEPTRPGAPEVPVSKPPKQQDLPPEFRRSGLEDEQERFDAQRAGLPPPSSLQARLTRLGKMGLAGAIVSIVLMVASGAIVIGYLPKATLQQSLQMSEMSAQQRQEYQKQVAEEITKVAQDHRWIGMMGTLGMVMWVASLISNFGVVFASGMHRRGYAWAGLVVNLAMLFVCFCSGIMQRFVGS